MRLTTSLFLAIITIAACGCQTFKGTDDINPALLEPSLTLRFADIPTPSGFKLLPKSSYSFENAGIRVGMLTYQGKASPDQVVNFYREQMAMQKWNLINIIEYGQRLLNFDRDTETCTVTVTPKGSGSLVTVALGPKSQAPSKKKLEQPLK